MDDIWEDGSDTEIERAICEQSFKKLQKDHVSVGFKAGFLESKEKGLQDGFNNGFIKGYEASGDVGAMIGFLRSVVTFSDHVSPLNPDLVEKSKELVCTLMEIYKSKRSCGDDTRDQFNAIVAVFKSAVEVIE